MYKNEIVKDLKDINKMIKDGIDVISKNELSVSDVRKIIKFTKTTKLRYEVLNKFNLGNIKIFNLGNIEIEKQMIALKQSSRNKIDIDQDYFFEFIRDDSKHGLLIVRKLDLLDIWDEIIPQLKYDLVGKLLMIPLHSKSKVIDKNGNIIRNNCWDVEPYIIVFNNDDSESITMIHMNNQLDNKEFEEMLVENANFQRTAMLYGLKLLTCKNINIKEEIIYKNKTITKKGKLKTISVPFETFYTLEIENTNDKIMFCNGHFKTFTKENPLFGKIVGTYWWQPQIKRSKKCTN